MPCATLIHRQWCKHRVSLPFIPCLSHPAPPSSFHPSPPSSLAQPPPLELQGGIVTTLDNGGPSSSVTTHGAIRALERQVGGEGGCRGGGGRWKGRGGRWNGDEVQVAEGGGGGWKKGGGAGPSALSKVEVPLISPLRALERQVGRGGEMQVGGRGGGVQVGVSTFGFPWGLSLFASLCTISPPARIST